MDSLTGPSFGKGGPTEESGGRSAEDTEPGCRPVPPTTRSPCLASTRWPPIQGGGDVPVRPFSTPARRPGAMAFQIQRPGKDPFRALPFLVLPPARLRAKPRDGGWE